MDRIWPLRFFCDCCTWSHLYTQTHTHTRAYTHTRTDSIGMCNSLPPPLLQAPPSALWRTGWLTGWEGTAGAERGEARAAWAQIHSCLWCWWCSTLHKRGGLPERITLTPTSREPLRRMCTDSPELISRLADISVSLLHISNLLNSHWSQGTRADSSADVCAVNKPLTASCE